MAWLPLSPGGQLAKGRRHRFLGLVSIGLCIAAGWLLRGRKRVLLYGIQRLKRRRPTSFEQDLIGLFDLLQQRTIEPVIARQFPHREARRAHELLGARAVTGKIALLCVNEHHMLDVAAATRTEGMRAHCAWDALLKWTATADTHAVNHTPRSDRMLTDVNAGVGATGDRLG